MPLTSRRYLPKQSDISQLPALEPPPGVTPNFVDPYTRGPLLLTLSAVAIGITFMFVIARFYCKIYLHNKLSWDDFTCVLATLGVLGIFTGLVFIEKAGLGTHQWDLRAVDLIKDSFLKPLYVLTNIQALVALPMKLTFFIYFLQIFGPKPTLRWSILGGALVMTVYYTACTIILFVLTTPRHGVTLAEQFESFLNKKTSPVLDTTFALGYFHVLSDLYILILPIWGVMGLNLRPKRKIGVILIFMTGLLALGASSTTIYYRYVINHSGDTTWNLMPASYLSVLEIAIGIICSCTPPCAIGIRRHLPLFVKFKLNLASLSRSLSARILPSGGSRYWCFFGRSRSGNSARNRKPETASTSGEPFVLKELPEIRKGEYLMKTAKALIWGSRNQTTSTMSDEERMLATRKP